MRKCIWANLLFSALLLSVTLCRAQAVFAAPADALNMTRLLFVDDVAGLSQYTPKQGARFAIGDICTIYVETAGFTLQPARPDSEDEFDLDLALDIAITMPQHGRTIASEQDFNTVKSTVRSKLPATFMAFSFAFEGDWDPGDYVIELTLRDNLSGQSVTREMAYQLEEPTEADRARQAEENTAR